MNPYWQTTLVWGFDDQGLPYLNSVDQFGTKFDNAFLFSGFATYFAGPILENNIPKDLSLLSKERAVELLEQVFRVLFYRDASAGDTIYFWIMEKDQNWKPHYSLNEKKLQTNWEHKLFKESHTERYHPIA